MIGRAWQPEALPVASSGQLLGNCGSASSAEQLVTNCAVVAAQRSSDRRVIAIQLLNILSESVEVRLTLKLPTSAAYPTHMNVTTLHAAALNSTNSASKPHAVAPIGTDRAFEWGGVASGKDGTTTATTVLRLAPYTFQVLEMATLE